MNYIDIKKRRIEYKISQIKLSEISGFSPAIISSWELKKNTPNAEQLKILSQTLEKVIKEIDEGTFDIRKKRIQTTKAKTRKLPKAIIDSEDYKIRFSKRKILKNNDYRQKLTELYLKSQQESNENAPKVLALFSGCGGFSLGFAAAGFKLVGHVEIEESANKIYAENFKTSSLLGTDICEITDEIIQEWIVKFKNIDVIIGGPPCQGFSLAGKRDANDIRNQLYKYYVHMVTKIRPKVFLMENVRLLTSMKTPEGTLFIDHIITSFSEAGYKIIKKEVDASDYGIPQSRKRVILIGVRNDIELTFEFPYVDFVDEVKEHSFPKNEKKKLTFKDATSDLETLESGEVSSDPLHWAIVHPEHVINWLKDVQEGCSAHENKNPMLRPPSGFNTTYKRIKWDEPCSTISTNFSMISGCRNVHPVSTRSLTIREATRAQSFPDEFIFVGKWGDIRKAIGNAVPPLLAKKIADAIYQQFFNSKN